MPNIRVERQRGLSAFRQIAIGTWRAPYDPQAYGSVTIEVDAALDYIERFRAATGLHLTITHVMAKAIGLVLEAVPEANAILRFNRIFLRREISTVFQVAMVDPGSGRVDLSAVKIVAPQSKALAAIVEEFEANAAAVRAGEDAALEATRRTFKKVPPLLIGRLLDLLGFLSYEFNLDLRWAGVPRDPYGSVLVTNVGMLGLDEAYAPLLPHGRVGLIVSLGAIRSAAVVREDVVVAGRVMTIGATFDHRLLDGAHAGKMVAKLREILADPGRHLEPLPSED